MATRHKWERISPNVWECVNCGRTRSKRGTLGYLYKGGGGEPPFEAGPCPKQKAENAQEKAFTCDLCKSFHCDTLEGLAWHKAECSSNVKNGGK